MVEAADTFEGWLEQADVKQERLNAEQVALLGAAFRFRQEKGTDYFSTRLLSHFLLHCDCNLKVAAIARLLGISRPTASTQQGLSSKEAIRQAHHRLKGRAYGKLLPRFAGPIAAFLLSHPAASRSEVLDFIDATFSVRVSRVALHKFLKKFGLDHLTGPVAPPPATVAPQHPPAAPVRPATVPGSPARGSPPPAAANAPTPPAAATTAPPSPGAQTPSAILLASGSILVPAPPPLPPFSSDARSTPEPSC